MRRSEINRIICNAKNFLGERNFCLPPWAYWGPDQWSGTRGDTDEIISNMLGWDITDFGSGNFSLCGLVLFTLRNGNPSRDEKPYAEKIMIVEEGQETPMHFHWSKMEDIINRGGGNLVIELWNSDSEGRLSGSKVVVRTDGVRRELDPGGSVILSPGESICLRQGMYHRFYGETGSGRVLVGEVSTVNDDTADNRFYAEAGRFPGIEEDEQPVHLLVSDYKKLASHG
ncbi:MAG: D-lyxose/D-mannose family sugar isomerase [Marinilabiliales bacterium]|nr:MAG: D-lyxose/D-mannose family sugar isomerase [Marinilabiliales bacterium]